MIDASAIICTYNPRPHYLTRVLAALRDQTHPMEQWELLLIDNASHEPLTAETWDLSWHPRARLIREEKLGLSAARMRGMRESSADLLVFIDDDNILGPNYLAEAVRIKAEWRQLGVWGGSIVPEFEGSPPDHLREFLSVLALREIRTPRWSNISTCTDAEPWGAGLCVRANVAAEYSRLCEQTVIGVGDRIGKSLLSGGDTEICIVACSLGLGMGLFPNLKITHLIPKERLEEDYLVRITEGIQTSLHLIGFKWHGILPSSPFSLLNFLRLCLNIVQKRGIYRRMYLAGIRARIGARRVIAANRNSDVHLLRNIKITSSRKM
jgi:glycosyltransferase involved in cell wall biosynthesis